MARQGMTKATMKRNSLGERPWASGRMEQDPTWVSRPKRPQAPTHVAIKAPKPNSHVHATIRANQRRLYNLQKFLRKQINNQL